MGIWSKILKGVAIGAAPFTGGASLAAMPMIDAVSKGLGGASQAAASNRGTKAEMMMDQNSDLERELLAREMNSRQARNDAYQGAIRADMAQTWKPATRPGNIPTISYGGGLSPEGLDAVRTAANQYRGRLGAADLQSPSGMPSYRNLAQDKDYQKTQKSGIWEKIAGIASAALPVAGMAMGGMGGGGYNMPSTPLEKYKKY